MSSVVPAIADLYMIFLLHSAVNIRTRFHFMAGACLQDAGSNRRATSTNQIPE